MEDIFPMKKLSRILYAGLFLALLIAPGTLNASEPKINLPALLTKKVPILLEFGRGWCKPCKYMKPILDDMSTTYAGKAIVMTVDMDVNKDLVRDFRIRLMPTQVFLTPDGKEFFRNEGVFERDNIMKVFAQMGVGAPVSQGGAPVPLQAPVQQNPLRNPATR